MANPIGRTNPSLLAIGEVVAELRAIRSSVEQNARRAMELSQVLERRAIMMRRATSSREAARSREEAVAAAYLERLERRASRMPLSENDERRRRELEASLPEARDSSDPASIENLSALLTYARSWGRLSTSILHGMDRSRSPERLMSAALERTSFDENSSMVPQERMPPRITAPSPEGAPRSDDFDEVYGEVLRDAENLP